MNKTKIPYLDFTWNPTHGCTSIAAGCENCWAGAMAKRLAGAGVRDYDPANPFKVICDDQRLLEPCSRKKPAVIGVSFMGDLFHGGVPLAFVGRVFAIMEVVRHHTYVLLTKRPGRADLFLRVHRTSQRRNPSYRGALLDLLDLLDKRGAQDKHSHEWQRDWPLPNVWLGLSASTQDDLDRDLPDLLQCPAAHRWLSLEPLLEPVNLEDRLDRIDAVAVGCESGPRRRPCKLAWIRSVVTHCNARGVPCLVKQIELDGRVVTDPRRPKWPKWAKQQNAFRPRERKR